jgi:hypothetical protein
MDVNAATTAKDRIHESSFDHRAKDAWDDEKTFLRVFIRRGGGDHSSWFQ